MEELYQQSTQHPYNTRYTLRDFIAMGFRHRQLIIFCFLAVFLGAILAALLLPKQYEAQMKILVKRERVDPVVAAEPNVQGLIMQGITEEDLNSEVELIKSGDLLERVVVDCNLQAGRKDSLWSRLFGPVEVDATIQSKANNLEISQAARTLEKKLTVEPLKKTKLIEVTYKSSNPQLAAKVLHSLAGLYLEKHLAVHRPPGAFDFFQQQSEQYRKDLSAAEQRLASFGRDQGTVSAQMEKEISVRKLNDFDATLKQTQGAIAETEQRIKTLETQAVETPSRLTTQVRTLDNAVLLQQMRSTLLNLELKRTELLTKYDPSYRLVQEVETQIAQTREALASAEKAKTREETTDRDPAFAWVEEELTKARTELTTLRARAAATAQIIQSYRDHVRQLSVEEIPQQDALRASKTAEENFLLYVRKAEEARISNALDQKRIVNVVIAEAATVPVFPSSPRWGLTLVLGLLFASLSSLGLAFAADRLDPSFRTPEEVVEHLSIPLIATTPKN